MSIPDAKQPTGGVTRRDVLRLLAATAAGTAVLSATRGLAHALTSATNPPTLVWITEGGDELNLLARLGQAEPGFQELVLLQWNVRDHDDLVPTGYSVPEGLPPEAPILVVETLPVAAGEAADEGPVQRFTELLQMAKAVILLGTDASYGGIRAGAEDVAYLERLCKDSKTPVIKLPGVPVPPQHLVGVLAHLEYFGFPRLDAHGRPMLYYGETVCLTCERRADLDAGRFADGFGEPGCLLRLGCKGLVTHNSCSRARWNEGENWCVGAGGPCTGCSEPGFPDHAGLGLYGRLPNDERAGRSVVWEHVDAVGYGVLGLAGAGIALQALRRLVFPSTEEPTGNRRREEPRS